MRYTQRRGGGKGRDRPGKGGVGVGGAEEVLLVREEAKKANRRIIKRDL